MSIRYKIDYLRFDWYELTRMEDVSAFVVAIDQYGDVHKITFEYWNTLPIRRPPSDIQFAKSMWGRAVR